MYSFFPEDICLAIKQTLADPPIIIPSEDENRNRIDVALKPLYIDPENELAKMVYPSLALYEVAVYPDLARNEVWEVYDNPEYDSDNKLVSVERRSAPVPHIVLVDIRAFTIFDQQRDIIRREVLRRLGGTPFGRLLINGVPVATRFLEETRFIPPSQGGMPETKDQRRRITQWRFRFETRFDVNERVRYPVVRDIVTGFNASEVIRIVR